MAANHEQEGEKEPLREEGQYSAAQVVHFDPMVLSAGRKGPNGVNAHDKIGLT
jgi:hypothetical protein